MSLAACSRFFRPYLGRIRPVFGSTRPSGCRLFSSLEKRQNLAVNRLQAVRHASEGGSSGLLNDNALLVVGIGLLGGSIFYVSIRLIILFASFFKRVLHQNSKLYLNPLFSFSLVHRAWDRRLRILISSPLVIFPHRPI